MYELSGAIKFSTGLAASGLRVRAFDRDMRRSQLLGEARVDRGGYYKIQYTPQFKRVEARGPDIVVHVLDEGGNTVATSGILFNVELGRRVDLMIDVAMCRPPSEYERHVRSVALVAEGIAIADLTDEDLEFLTGELEIPLAELRYLRTDAQLARRHEVVPSAFHALFRDGLPTDLSLLLAHHRSVWERALRRGIASNVVAKGLECEIEAIVARLEDIAVAQAFEAPIAGQAPIGVVLRESGLGQAEQAKIVRLVLREEPAPMHVMWDNLAKRGDVDAQTVAVARFASEAHEFVLGELATFKVVVARSKRENWKRREDLARLDRGAWRALVEEGGAVPEDFATADDYAEAIARKVESTMPTASVAHRLAADPSPGLREVARVLLAQPEFDLQTGRVETLVGDGAALRGDVARLQRVVKLVPTERIVEGTTALLAAGYDSARAIALRGKNQFSARMVPVMGQEWVDVTYARAEMRSDVTQMQAFRAWDYFGPIVVNPRVERMPAEMPTWARMFGTLDSCACEHCRSVLSPAAYLTDLLKFVEDAPASSESGTRAPFEVLADRRPDLQRILLSCANANVPLPHIDLVNELLEDLVLDRLPVAHQTEGTVEERRLRPAVEDSAAYAITEAAVFPLALPLELGHERSVLAAGASGVELHRLWRLFGRPEEDVVRARLGIGESEWRLITTDVEGVARDARWGGATLGEVTSVPVFLERTGLTYAELEGLIQTTFFTSAIGPIAIDRGEQRCDPADDELVGLTDTGRDQIQRFLRTTRRFGWALLDSEGSPLDRALHALGQTRIDGAAIQACLRARDVATSVRMSVEELAELDAPRLAAALGTTAAELDAFLLVTRLGTVAGLPSVLACVEAWQQFRPSNVDPRELAHILVGWDQVPAAFASSEEELRTTLRALHELVARLEPGASAEATVLENLIDILGLEADVVDVLLRSAGGLVHAETDPTQVAIVDLLAFTSIPVTSQPPDEAEPARYEAARRVLIRLHRIARMVRGLGLDARELPIAAETRVENEFLGLDDLTVRDSGDFSGAAALYAGWLALVRAKRVQRTLPRADRDLFDQLHDGGRVAADRTDVASFADLASDTGWNVEDVLALSAAFGLNGDPSAFRRVSTYERLRDAAALVRRLDVPAATLASWVTLNPDDLAAALLTRIETRPLDEVRRIITQISDQLRERKRDGLLAHLLQQIDESTGERRFGDVDEVYAHYLIDPSMASCAQTSRIVQATAAVQMFVQRCRMGLEPEVVVAGDDDYWQRWEWMKNYRVWEANRKVFLYPENWIEPELRDDKTPFFRELENALQQDDVRGETVERALLGYLQKLAEVSHLDIRGLYHEPERKTLHIFARTQAMPHVYYYRRRVGQTWTPWEAVDLDIQGDHLIPVVFRGHLLLFWPVFDVATEANEASGEPTRYSSIRLVWSEHVDGKWQPRQTGTDKPILTRGGTGENVAFKGLVEEDELYLRVYQKEEVLGVFRSVLRLRFDPCMRKLVNDPAPDTLFYASAYRTRYAGMSLAEKTDDEELIGETGDQLFVTLFLGGDVADGVSEETEELLTEGGLHGFILGLFLALADISGEWTSFLNSRRSLELLRATPGQFSLLPAHQERQFILGEHPFVFACDGATYLVSPYERRGWFAPYTEHRFEPLFQPYACEIHQVTYREGLTQLFKGSTERPTAWPARQRARDTTHRFQNVVYTTVIEAKQVDFALAGSYGTYNWELFFHIPLLAADQLSKRGRYEEAEQWFRRIFDPTDTSTEERPANVWQTKPLFEAASEPPQTLEALMTRLSAEDAGMVDQLEAWLADPFNPHAIARLRTPAYMRAVVMKYLDHLIAWADDLFRQDTRETSNEAAQLYVVAAALLGPRPTTISREETESFDYERLRGHLDDFANAMIELENDVPADLAPGSGRTGALPPNLLPYYCIPQNEKLLGYWDAIADRLFKIRNCMDIGGRVRELALFEPPIDPALLVRARAAGVDLREALRELREPPAHHRYAVLYQKAVEACNEVRALCANLLSALEKKDAEELSRLRTSHEISLLTLVTTIRRAQIDETRQTIASLRASLDNAHHREEFYRSREHMNAGETLSMELNAAAHGVESAAKGLALAAAIAHAFPQVHAGADTQVESGGRQAGDILKAVTEGVGAAAGHLAYAGGLAATMAGYQRRKEDWDLQGTLAGTDAAQIERQIAAAEIRLAIVEQELANHQTQVDQVREVERHLRDKFTSRELYGWMTSQLAVLHQRSYQLALDLAKRAESAARRELGLSAAEFTAIGHGHWDATRRGMLAGDRLYQELRAMDSMYLDRHRRELEITKHISVARLDPQQILRLRATGSCDIHVPEVLFDLDFPGHYRRRIKAVTLTIPCVKGPYTSISARLTLQRSEVRWTPAAGAAREPVHVAESSIATSAANADGGVFELSFRDERFLPFEGAGAVSVWKLELPDQFRSFDYDTIPDVILHMQYTATEDRDASPTGLQARVTGELTSTLNDWIGAIASSATPLARAFSMKEEFSTQLHRFLHPSGTGSHELEIEIDRRHLPYFLHDQDLGPPTTGGPAHAEVLIRTRSMVGGATFAGLPLTLRKGDSSAAATAVPYPALRATLRAAVTAPLDGGPFGRWRMTVERSAVPPELAAPGADRLDPDLIEDVVLLVRYRIV